MDTKIPILSISISLKEKKLMKSVFEKMKIIYGRENYQNIVV